MELLTNILIWIGILTAVVVVALAIHEFVWKPRQAGGADDQPERDEESTDPVGADEAAKDLQTASVDADPVGETPIEPVAVPEAPAEPDDRLEQQFKQLTRTQRLSLARLTSMATDFDRDAGLAVAACKDGDFDAIVRTGLVLLNEETGRYSMTETGRGLGAEHLTPEDEKLVRQFMPNTSHAWWSAPIRPDVSDREAAVMGFEMVQNEWPHLEAVLNFLMTEGDNEPRVLEFAEAVNATGILQSQPDDGLRWYAIMLEAARKLKNREKELDALGNLGALHAGLDDPSNALECYTQGAEICRDLDDRHGEGACLGNIGLAWQKLGDTEKAVECFEKTLVIMRETEDVVREGFALASLGQAAEQKDDFTKAIDYHEQHIKLTVESGDPSGEMLALAHLGGAYLAAGRASEAIGRFERQLKLAKSLNEVPAEGNAHGNLGRSYRELGNHDKAAEHSGRQIEIAHMLNDTSVGLHAMGELGQCHQDANRTWKAVECFDDQLKLARQVGDREREAQALWSAARAVRSLGRTPDAITRISAALAIFESIESPDLDGARADLEKWRSETA